jgi:broad specificity phosphatase PhoE
MKIILIRHFKVNFQWKFAYNSKGFEKACHDYDGSNIVSTNFKENTNKLVISSTMFRAIETTKIIFNKLPDISSDLLREVPIKPFIKTKIFLPVIMWNIIGRIQWRLNSTIQPESYLESQLRINNFVDAIITKNEDCIIVAHGWIIKLIIKRLIKEKFRGLNPIYIRTGFKYEYIS